MGKLDLKRVIITGASSGIGLAATREFARAGADLALLARSEDGLDRAAAQAREHGATAHVIPVDLADREAAERAVAQAIERLDGLDVLVTNHAASAYGTFRDLPAADFDRSVQSAFHGAVYVIRAALDELESSGGVVVANAATAARSGIPDQSPYAAAKHALRGFLNTLRVELDDERSKVRIAIVHPAPDDAYSPDAVPAALVEAAVNPRPEITVGSSGAITNLLTTLARPLADAALTTYGIARGRG